jgi:hypothetical protein
MKPAGESFCLRILESYKKIVVVYIFLLQKISLLGTFIMKLIAKFLWFSNAGKNFLREGLLLA